MSSTLLTVFQVFASYQLSTLEHHATGANIRPLDCLPQTMYLWTASSSQISLLIRTDRSWASAIQLSGIIKLLIG
jgi:hypothetical protein